jgi:medium-chain acyl-[acyl-carrier-protein] hydrolase
LPDAAFVEALVQRYDAIPQVVRNEPELMALFVPTLKADFATFETHQHYEEAPLDCALALYGGQDDPQTHQMNGWTSLCSGPRKARIFPGGHFYFLNQRPALAEALAEDVLASVPAE